MSEAEVLPRKVPSMRPGRGIVEVGWGSTLFIHAAGNQSGRTWEAGSRARKVPAQMQVVLEGHWDSVNLLQRQAGAGSGHGDEYSGTCTGQAGL